MPKILVITTVHNPNDARIRYRQIDTLLHHGWDVSYAAHFTEYGLNPATEVKPGLHLIDLPRASGRRRLRGLISAHKLLKQRADQYDLVLMHDPELLISCIGSGARNTVLDVHEDAAAAIEAKRWIPRALRRPIYGTVRMFERWAEKRMPLLLAEYEYQKRFKNEHPVVPNAVRVPKHRAKPSSNRVVYLGALTIERGAQEIADLARALRSSLGGDLQVDVIGSAHGVAAEIIGQAHAEGLLQWHGFVPSREALKMLDGALVGLSLLHDMPNYRHSMPTKILEYMAHGVPVVTTPLPVAVALVDSASSGIVVPFNDVDATVRAIEALRDSPGLAEAHSASGYATTKEKYDWNTLGKNFHEVLTGFIR